MKIQALVFAAVICAIHGAAPKFENDVAILTEDTFDEFVKENNFVLVEFYAPWCGHCKALAPEYDGAAGTLKEEGSEIKLGKVDATEETKLATRFGVRGYPTIKLFKMGTDMEYSGGRTAGDIVAWLKKKTGPAAITLETVEAAETFVASKDVVVVGFFKDASSDNAKAFMDTAFGIDDVDFAITSVDAVLEKYEAADGSVVLYKKFDEGKNVFDGEFSVADLTSFVRTNSLPLVVEFSDETANKIFGGDIKIHNLLFVKKTSDDYKTIIDAFTTVAGSFKGKVLFVLIDGEAESNGRILEYFGLEDGDMPTVRLITLDGDMKKYKPTVPELTQEALTAFVNDFIAGNLKPHLRSEEVPDDWNSTPVKVLVGTNFVEVALDPAKDVLVEFYAPWCGHCKQLAPIFEELGEHFKDNEKVVIAKMDSTKNEVEEAQIRSFPTLKFWKKDTNEVVDYNGDRTLEAMIEFIESGGESAAGADMGEEEGEEEDDEQMRDEL